MYTQEGAIFLSVTVAVVASSSPEESLKSADFSFAEYSLRVLF